MGRFMSRIIAVVFLFCKQKTAYEVRISDWSSDVCSSDLLDGWWDEWYDGRNGWAIPTADSATSDEERDDLESAALYDLIEHQQIGRASCRERVCRYV